MIHAKHARFVTVHLAALDHLEHASGPFSRESAATLEEIDRMVGKLDDAMRKEWGNAAICIVSDHGFAPIEHQLNIRTAFVDAGLITITQGPVPKVADWVAAPWISGGLAMVVMRNPDDSAARAKVEKFLNELAADAKNGIAGILSHSQIVSMGGAPNAQFAIDLQPGFSFGDSLQGPLLQATHGGTHGYSPTHPEMLASFFMAGSDIRRDVDLGEIDMRAIAPTLAKYLGVPFPTADVPPLEIASKE